MKRLLFAIAMTACNQVFDIAATEPLDAYVAPDLDGDDTPDSLDNCVGLANDQTDSDEDGVGDTCDNCPLVANLGQENEGDGDRVGDACDPHGRGDGDCLVALDVFTASDRFAQRWQIIANGSAPTITHGIGSITVTPSDMLPVSLVALDEQGVRFTGVFDTQLLASTTITTGAVYAMSNISVPGSGYGCGLGIWMQSVSAEPIVRTASASAEWTFPGFLRGEPVDSRLLLRLIAPTATGTSFVCVASYGLAVGGGSTVAYAGYEPGLGGPGVLVIKDAITLDAIALYRKQPDPCPETIYR